jgi:hypothetical protein
MKLTESKLRSIILEELERLTENVDKRTFNKFVDQVKEVTHQIYDRDAEVKTFPSWGEVEIRVSGVNIAEVSIENLGGMYEVQVHKPGETRAIDSLQFGRVDDIMPGGGKQRDFMATLETAFNMR